MNGIALHHISPSCTWPLPMPDCLFVVHELQTSPFAIEFTLGCVIRTKFAQNSDARTILAIASRVNWVTRRLRKHRTPNAPCDVTQCAEKFGRTKIDICDVRNQWLANAINHVLWRWKLWTSSRTGFISIDPRHSERSTIFECKNSTIKSSVRSESNRRKQVEGVRVERLSSR